MVSIRCKIFDNAELDHMDLHYEKDDLGLTLHTNHLKTGQGIIITAHKSQMTN